MDIIYMENPELSKKFETKENVKPTLWVSWGQPGHFREYTVNFPEYNMENYIPQQIVSSIKTQLGDGFMVENRGTRLEIHPSEENQLIDSHIALAYAMQALFGDAYKVEFINMFEAGPTE